VLNNEVINAVSTYNAVRDRIVEAINKLYIKLFEEANSINNNVVKHISLTGSYYGPGDVHPIDDTDSIILLQGSEPLAQRLNLWEVEGSIWIVWDLELMHRITDSYWKRREYEPHKFLFNLGDLEDIDAFVQREFKKRFSHWVEDGRLVSHQEAVDRLESAINSMKEPLGEEKSK